MQTLCTATALILALLAPSLAAEAQPVRKVPRIGFLTWETCPNADSVFGVALRNLGYTWGQTIEVVCRSAQGDYGRLSEAAAALVAQKVDAIAALTHITAYAAQRATRSIPIVMIASGSSGDGSRGQPWPSRRQRHGIDVLCNGAG